MDGKQRVLVVAACAVTGLNAGCGDTTETAESDTRLIEASLSPDLLAQLSSHEAFAQTFALRENGSVEEIGEAVQVDVDRAFTVPADIRTPAVTYEVRVIQGNARIASAMFRDPSDMSVISKESTVEADVVLNSVRDGRWCDSCSVGLVRYLVTAPTAGEFCSVGKSYHNSIRFYAHGVTSMIDAFNGSLRESPAFEIAAYTRLNTRLDKAYRAYEDRTKKTADPELLMVAQRELDLAFVDVHSEAGFTPYQTAIAGQLAAEMMRGTAGGIDPLALPSSTFEAERLRARLIGQFVSTRLAGAGIDANRLSGLNSELAAELETIPGHGAYAHLAAERAWLAYQMGILAAFAKAHPVVSLGRLLLELEELDVLAKGTVNRIAVEQTQPPARTAVIREALDVYRTSVDQAAFHAALARAGVSKTDVAALADVLFFVSVPAHGVPFLDMANAAPVDGE